MRIHLTCIGVFIVANVSFCQEYNVPPPPPPLVVTPPPPGNYYGRYVHFGLNVTPGVYWLAANANNDAGNGASFGFGYGLNMEFYFTQNYGFCTGLEVNYLAAHYTNTVTDSSTVHNESLQYLEIPLLLKMKTNSFGLVRFFGLAGLKTGFLLKSTDDYTVYPNIAYVWWPPHYNKDNVDIYNQTDFFRLSLLVGLGIEYNLIGNTCLQFSLNYDNGFTNLNNTGSSKVLLKGVSATVGILF